MFERIAAGSRFLARQRDTRRDSWIATLCPELRPRSELYFSQQFNGLAIMARQFLYGHGQAETQNSPLYPLCQNASWFTGKRAVL
jgi:hypothetical protein